MKTNQAMQGVAAQAAIGQEPVTRTIVVAITGDAISDLMAAIRVVCDQSELSARQIQFVFECYAKLYKDAAEKNDANELDRRALQRSFQEIGNATSPPLQPHPGYPQIHTSSGTGGQYKVPNEYCTPRDWTHSEIMREMKREFEACQSGTQTPSIHSPDSVCGSAGSGCVNPGAFD